jgi:hypothetical protein
MDTVQRKVSPRLLRFFAIQIFGNLARLWWLWETTVGLIPGKLRGVVDRRLSQQDAPSNGTPARMAEGDEKSCERHLTSTQISSIVLQRVAGLNLHPFPKYATGDGSR